MDELHVTDPNVSKKQREPTGPSGGSLNLSIPLRKTCPSKSLRNNRRFLLEVSIGHSVVPWAANDRINVRTYKTTGQHMKTKIEEK
jgi:hypothetical protein